MTGEIKACPNPWCKSHDRSDDEIFKAHRPILTASRSSFERAVACPVCPIQTPWFATEAEAIAAWEDRTSDACASVQKERDALRDFMEEAKRLLGQISKSDWASIEEMKGIGIELGPESTVFAREIDAFLARYEGGR